MKHFFTLAIVTLISISGFAQRKSKTYEHNLITVNPFNSGKNILAKTTAVGDTLTLRNIADSSALAIYTLGADSGYAAGINYWNDQAFAERYSVNGDDSSVIVVGVMAEFGGKVNSSSTKTINFNVWSVGAYHNISATLLYTGYPSTIIDSVTYPITSLGIGAVTDTMKTFMFSTPTPLLSGPFFVGYSINYDFGNLNGDTIGLTSSINGIRSGRDTSYELTYTDFDTTLDTFINVQNATMESDNNWYDNYTQNDGIRNNLAIFPIVVIHGPTGIKGVTHNNITLFGNYPNPAINNTNIKFSIAAASDVTIQLMDVKGRIINKMYQPCTPAGEHIIPVSTSQLPAGDYMYLIRTSLGNGMAGKMTVSK